MANITILEKDLTKAAFQLSPEDVVFVPGFSVKDDATTDLTYVETIEDFEKAFGTCPRLMYETFVKSNVGDIDINLNLETYTAQFKVGVKLVYKLIGESLGWRYEKGSTIVNLSSLGISIDPSSHEFKEGDTLEVMPSYDKCYIYAKELLMAGLPIVYQVVETQAISGKPNYSKYSVEALTEVLKSGSVYDYTSKEGIMDKGEYSIKYVTSGICPSFIYEYDETVEDPSARYDFSSSFAQRMLNLASARGDCVALIDPDSYATGAIPYYYTDEEGSILTDSHGNLFVSDTEGFSYLDDGSLWGAAQAFADNATNLEYGAMFAPWATYYSQAPYTDPDTGKTIRVLDEILMPPSFGYLITLAKSVRTNNNWLAIAGIARGQVPYFAGPYTLERLSNNTANKMQPRNGKTSINAITNIRPYGYTIWGNRTMKNNEDNARGGDDGLTATSFLNIRNMVSDVKKTAYNAAKQCMFEQNSDVLWVNFCSMVTPLLDKLMSGQGLSNYKIIKQPTDEKAKLKATIVLYPIYAVEDFEITIELQDKDVSVI